MADSKYHSTWETTNFTRIARIIFGPCTDILRDVLMKEISPSELSYKVTSHDLLHKFKNLQINKVQLHLVYSGNYSKFDIVLLYFLLRNVCSFPPYRNQWGKYPSPGDRSVSANIERIRIIRNEIVHNVSPKLSNSEFEHKWKDLFQIVQELEGYLGFSKKYQEFFLELKLSSINPDEGYLVSEEFDDIASLENEVNKCKEKLEKTEISISSSIIKEDRDIGSKRELNTAKTKDMEYFEPKLQELEGCPGPSIEIMKFPTAQKMSSIDIKYDFYNLREEMEELKAQLQMTRKLYTEQLEKITKTISSSNVKGMSRFEGISSRELNKFFNSFKVDYPDDPRGESFVRHIIPDDMLRKLVTAVNSLSKGIVLTKNILTRKHDFPIVEACVLEVNVVFGGVHSPAIKKDVSSNDFFDVNEDYITRVILIKSRNFRKVDEKLIVYRKFEHVINRRKIILQHEDEKFDNVAKFIAYQMLSSFCTFVESMINAFTMDLPKIISDCPVKSLTEEKIKQICLEVFERIEDETAGSMDSNRDWRRWVAEEIQRNMRTKEEPKGTDPWVKINKICRRTVEDLHSILTELEKYQTKVLPIANDRQFAAWLKEKDAKDRINRRGPMFHVYKHFPGFTDPKKPIHTKVEASGFQKKLDSDQTEILEEKEPHEKIPMSKPEIPRFGPIASQKLKELFNSFELDYPDDPRGGSFVRHIIPDDMLRKLVTAVKSLSKGIGLTKNILTRKHEMPTVETYVFEVDVVHDGDQFRATRKDASSNEFFNVNKDYLTRVILIKSRAIPVVEAKLMVYKKYKHVINKRNIFLQHEYEDSDDVAKFIAYQMLSSFCSFLESVIIAFTMDLPQIISDYPVKCFTRENLKQTCLEVFERIEDRAAESIDSNRDWRRLVAFEIINRELRKTESISADAWVQIYDICRKTVEDLHFILIELEQFRTYVFPADQNKHIEEWMKREIIHDRSVLQKYPSILKYITGYRDSVDKKQVVKVFLNCEDKETEMFFKKCCNVSKDLQFEFVNVERFKDQKKEDEQIRLLEREAPPVDKSTRTELKQIIKKHAKKIYALFSNVIGIQVGAVRQVGDSIQKEACIILYCLDKSLIPFGEKPLPKTIAGRNCDIREDFVRFGRCPENCQARNQSHPDPGCNIGIKSDSSSGSAGFLYESRTPENELGDGFFTAAHVAVKNITKLHPDTSFTMAHLSPDDNIIVHRSMPKIGHNFYRVGRVVEAFFGQHEDIDLDFAVVKITEKRNGGKEILTVATEDDLKLKEDIVTKTGTATETTRGRLMDDTLSLDFDISGIKFESDSCYSIEYINSNDDPFFREGDSGSGVYVIDKDTGKPIKPLGIAFAYTNWRTAVCKIGEIVDELDLQIVRYFDNKD